MLEVQTPDGGGLYVRERGTGLPLLLVHGFTGSSEAWGEELLDELASEFRLLAVDLIGHGCSDRPHEPKRYALASQVRDLCALLDSRGVERAVWLGYSMGGRIALGAALLCPQRIRGLVLESASAGLDSDGERRARIAHDETLARRLEDDGLEKFVAYWMGFPLFATQAKLGPAALERERERRLRNDPAALAASLRGMGTGVQPSFWKRLHDVRAPALVLAGSEDEKFCALARRMAARLPQAQLELIPGAGHAPHLEQPETYLSHVRGFCRRIAEETP